MTTASDRAYELANGFRATQIVHAAIELGIPDLLAGGPMSVDELSSATGIERRRLRRLVRSMLALGLLTEDSEARVSNTEVGELFRRGVPGSRRAQVRMLVPESYRTWDHFLTTLRTGQLGHELAHGGSLWQHLARDPDYADRFNDSMASNSEGVAEFVAMSADFTGAKVVVDVGGGKGSLVAGVLHAHPSLRGVVLDVAAGLAQTSEYLAARRVADRCEMVEGDFFRSVPPGDVYLLKDILHDWEDAEATAILRVVRRAMNPGGRVIVVERVIPSHVTESANHLSATITDLQMMVQLGGQERTVEEYGELFAAAGLRLDRVTPSGGTYQLVEGV